jgi:phytoene/squalene synthetase
MDFDLKNSHVLAAAITKAASKQTYYTIRFFVDRDLVADAFRAYGYFRWVDDALDGDDLATGEKLAFIRRQESLLEACYRGETPAVLSTEEQILADLVANDRGVDSGLHIYLRNMMEVMIFDARRRGEIISRQELHTYSHKLAVAVTEAMYYFIGNESPAPHNESRYLAVTAAHITHMLRDSHEDVQAGYFNIPREVLQADNISPQDVDNQSYRKWVCKRVKMARRYFKAGRASLAQIRNVRCRLVGFAYTARFEWMLRVIEGDNFCLRSEYAERRGLPAGLWMAWSTLASLLLSPWMNLGFGKLIVEPARSEK